MRSFKWAYPIVGLLMLESVLHRNALLAYQNPLAGRTPWGLDSNTDWGQGLKSLGKRRSQYPAEKLALSLFGGSLPETYGITEYVALPSFPALPNHVPLISVGFMGYVAVSRNALFGYGVDHPSMRELLHKEPLECFQDALCVFDVRGIP